MTDPMTGLMRDFDALNKRVKYLEALETPFSWTFLAAPLTSVNWDGDAYSTTAKTVIDLSVIFGAPAGIKAALFYFTVRDSGSAATDTYLILAPNNTANEGMTVNPLVIADRANRGCIVVPCDANGDVYYQIVASGAATFDVWLQIFGYLL